MSLCQYKNIFGAPGTGVHSYRLFGVAIFDVISTFILALVLNYFIKTNYFVVLIFCFCLGIIMHKLFCVETTIGKIVK